jgi:hypothetical protein
MRTRLVSGLLLVVVVLVHPGGAPTQGASARVAVIGDFGLAGPDEQAVAGLVSSWAPDFVVTTGDNNYYLGASSTIDANVGQYYHAYIAPYHGHYGAGAATNRFFPTLGNHDYDTPDAKPYLSYFTLPGNERYYDVVRGPVHLFVLDSNWEEPDGVQEDSVQAAWLQARLAASTARWKLVTMHHPPYSSGHHGSSDWMQWPFETWGAHAVLSGHDHLYERVTLGNLVYFVNGLGGAERYVFEDLVPGSQVRYNADFGAMLVEADDAQITFRFISSAGALVDTYTLYANPAAHPPAAPSGLTALAVPVARVDLAWVDNASNEDDVRVERSTDGVTFTPVATLARDTTSYAVTGLSPSTTYQFRIVARNAAGASAPSPVASATTSAGGAPSAPAGLTVRLVSATRLDLAWTDTASNESTVSVEQAQNGGAFAAIAALGANATTFSATGLTGTVSYAYRVRAGNSAGWSAYSNTVTARPAIADLAVTALANVPAAMRPGGTASVKSTTANQGTASARSTVTRYYLVDGVGRRTLLNGSSSISTLALGQQVTVTTSVGVPSSVAAGDYQMQACADVGQLVPEASEDNNCRAWSTLLHIGWPDLVTVSVSEPPSHARLGATFTVSDTVANSGVMPANASKNQYFLSVNGQPGTKLNGERVVPKLSPGQQSSGSVSVSVHSATPLGTYRLLACADATRANKEASETNNCRASVGSVVVGP